MLPGKTTISETAEQLQQRLSAFIRERIAAAGGRLKFAEFMQMALYSPQLGYYQNGLQKFGAAGDFVTAPELGDLFAAGIVESVTGYQSEKRNDRQNRGATDNKPYSPENWLEIGAGTGVLAADILIRLESLDCLPENYYILEPSAYLSDTQRILLNKKIPSLVERVTWLSELPLAFEGVILANEVVDAIPCERIQKTKGQWHYLDVVWESGNFALQTGDLVPPNMLPHRLLPKKLRGNKHLSESQAMKSLVDDEFIDGYTTEVRPLAEGWVRALGHCLASGSILLIDYGYPEQELYHPQRVTGSLRCFCQHRASDNPLELIGLQDITAHVDFTALARSAIESGLSVEGFSPQSGFLLENHILKQVPTDETAAYQFSQQVQKLTAPGQMGELIKVLLLQKQQSRQLAGFKLQDQLYRL